MRVHVHDVIVRKREQLDRYQPNEMSKLIVWNSFPLFLPFKENGVCPPLIFRTIRFKGHVSVELTAFRVDSHIWVGDL